MKRTSSFADRLKEYRTIMNNYTFADLEKITGIPAQTLNRYELGQRMPKIDVAGEIADKIEVDTLWLQGYDVTPEPKKEAPVTADDEHFDFSMLTEEQMDILGLTKPLTPEQQRLVVATVRAISEEIKAGRNNK